jgi:hypothetical protein
MTEQLKFLERVDRKSFNSTFDGKPSNGTLQIDSLFISGRDIFMCNRGFSFDNTKGFINQYEFGSDEQDIANTSFVTKFETTAEVRDCIDVTFTPDGKTMIVLGSDDDFVEYSLSQSFDLTSTVNVVQQGTLPGLGSESRSLFFKPDGETALVGGEFNNIFRLSVGEPFDLSTATLENEASIDLQATTQNIRGINYQDFGDPVQVDNFNNGSKLKFELSPNYSIDSTGQIRGEDSLKVSSSNQDVKLIPRRDIPIANDVDSDAKITEEWRTKIKIDNKTGNSSDRVR